MIVTSIVYQFDIVSFPLDGERCRSVEVCFDTVVFFDDNDVKGWFLICVN